MRRALWIFAAALTGLYALSYWHNAKPIVETEMHSLVARLFHFASVGFVHDGYAGQHTALFTCVSEGYQLNAAQSATYRHAVHVYLQSKQSLFRRLDSDLQQRQDHGLSQPNNADGRGIEGKHDHHDSSFAANLSDLNASLEALERATPFRRVALANNIYKDLLDLMVHMAPAVHAIGVAETIKGTGHAAAFHDQMKAAQFAPINSKAYWSAIDAALRSYAAFALEVQGRVDVALPPALTAISGRFLSLQTIAPRLKGTPVRTRSEHPCSA